MRFQQNQVSRRAEHCTERSARAVAMEKEDGSRRTTALPLEIGRVRCPRRAVPAVEAPQQLGGCSLALRGGIDCVVVGEHAVVVHACGGGDEG